MLITNSTFLTWTILFLVTVFLKNRINEHLNGKYNNILFKPEAQHVVKSLRTLSKLPTSSDSGHTSGQKSLSLERPDYRFLLHIFMWVVS